MKRPNKLEVNWGGPVFPTSDNCLYIGMTVREFFAGAALIGLLTQKEVKRAQCGRLALDIADMLLKAVKEDSL